MKGTIRNHAITVLICYAIATSTLIYMQWHGWQMIPPSTYIIEHEPRDQTILDIFDQNHRKGK